jgi:type IV pilus assembly protein PilA
MKKGFTLIEVLLVVIIISVLTAIVLVAINPARQIAQANNSKRAADVTTILNAVSEYVVDNGGELPPSEEDDIVIAPRNMSIASSDVDICDALVPTYVAELPFDPSDPDAYFTSCNDYDLKYEISRETDDRVTIYAPNAQLGEDIEVTR